MDVVVPEGLREVVEQLSTEELLLAVRRANRTLLDQAVQISRLNHMVMRLSGQLSMLCDLHLQGRNTELAAEIKLLAEQYQHEKAVLEAARRVH